MLLSLGIVSPSLVRCVFFSKYCILWGGIHAPHGPAQSLRPWQAVPLPGPGQGLGPSQGRLGNACFWNCPAATVTPSFLFLLTAPASPTAASWIPEQIEGVLAHLM